MLLVIRLKTVMVFASLVSVCLASAGHAESWVTGAQLAQACAGHSPKEMQDCDGYLAGVLDAVASVPELKGAMCPPAHTKLGVLREALGKFGQQRPEATKGTGVALVQTMIKTNYPCPAS